MGKKTEAKRVYGKRVFALGEELSNDTRITKLNNNDLIIGTSGRGKTGGYVIPNIQNIDGSLVVSDSKGQLERRFRGELEDKGYIVNTLDFMNPDRSCGYNPLSFIRKNKNGSLREQDVMTIANVLCPLLDNKEPIWDMCARHYISFLIGYCMEAEPVRNHNLIRVSELHRRYNSLNGSIPFEEWVMDHQRTFAARKYLELMANKNAEKMWASIMGFVNMHLEPFSFSEAEYIFGGKNSVDISSLGQQKEVLFLNVSDTDRTFDAMSDLFYAQALQILCSEADKNPDGRLAVPVRLILDDFAACAKIPDFDNTISVIRSRDISVSIVLQSLSQFEAKYTKSSGQTIINNCDNILYLGGHDLETAQFIASSVCKTPETVLSMPIDKAYLIRTGEKARLVTKIVPYSTVSDYEEE